MNTLATIIGGILAFIFVFWVLFGNGFSVLFPFLIIFILFGLLMALVKVAVWGLFGLK